MSEQAFQDSAWLLTRARGVGLVLRVLVLVAPLAALLCARVASGRMVLVLDACVLAFTLYCVIVPDSHVGLVVAMLVGARWLASVDDTTTPWALGAALALLAFHTSLAAASVAAPAARWSAAMRRRWLRRVGVVALLCAATWSVTAAIGRYDVAASSALVLSALVILAAAGLWARNVTLDARVSRP
jgi:hypothetical protein